MFEMNYKTGLWRKLQLKRPPCTPSKLDLSGKFHQGGPFLDGFYSHLRTRAGGNRGEHSATQITRYVGKYLYSLDAHAVATAATVTSELSSSHLCILHSVTANCD